MYLLDANCLIAPHHSYLNFDLVPQFWEWLVYLAEKEKIGITSSVFQEVTKNEDWLKAWLEEHKEILLIDDTEIYTSGSLVKVLTVYGKNSPGGILSEKDMEILDKSADSKLIAFALSNNHLVVSNEKLSKGQKVGKNRKIPDVCKDLKIECINDLEFIKALNFSTYLRQNN